MGAEYSTKYLVVEKAQLDDLIAAYNAAAEFIGIVKCASCGVMHPSRYICPECGVDPDDVGSKAPDLKIKILGTVNQ